MCSLFIFYSEINEDQHADYDVIHIKKDLWSCEFSEILLQKHESKNSHDHEHLILYKMIMKTTFSFLRCFKRQKTSSLSMKKIWF